MKILLVDDDSRFADSVAGMLRMREHEVVTMHTSQDALDELTGAEMDEKPFDVVITDWDLGLRSETDGDKLVAEVKWTWPTVGIVLWSALMRPESEDADLQITKMDSGELLSWLVLEGDMRAGN